MKKSIEKSADELVMVFIVRRDLKMNRGKIAAQVGHAVQDLITRPAEPRILRNYLSHSCTTKLVKRCESLEEMDELENILKAKKIPFIHIIDFGRTQVAPDTKTVLGIGPRMKSELDEYVRRFPLYS